MKSIIMRTRIFSLFLAVFSGCAPAAFCQQTADQSNDTGTVPSSTGSSDSSLSFQADLYTGRFKYGVPIALAPGRQGTDPKLSLGYNSAKANGWCGVGWSLDVGYIQRDVRHGIPIQWSVGSSNSLPQYDDSKGFDVNFGGTVGILVPVGPTNQNPIVYRQQVDKSFLLFNYYTNNYWTVVDKSGNTFYFGEGLTNQMENGKTGWMSGAASSTFRWVLDRTIDVNGNEAFMQYTNDSGMLYLSKITYNANTNSPALAASCEVDFILTNRPDISSSLISGYKVKTQFLLSEIDVKTGGANVRKYVLGYNQSTSTLRSLLNSVTEYGSDYSTALPPITFNYQVQNFGFGSPITWPGVYTAQTSDPLNWNGTQFYNGPDYSAIMCDIDGDGLPDRVLRMHDSPYTNYFAVQRNTGFGFAPISTNYQWKSLNNVDQQTDLSWNSPIHTDANGRFQTDLVDLNGDGYPDRVMEQRTGAITNWYVQLNTGLEGTNGFGLPSAWTVLAETVNTDYRQRAIQSPQNVTLLDINGDGLPDRVLTENEAPYDRFKVQINTGHGFTTNLLDWVGVDTQGQGSQSWGAVANPNVDNSNPTWDGIMIDINGDGLPDRVFRKATIPYTNYFVQLNNGAGFDPGEAWYPLTNYDSVFHNQNVNDLACTMIDMNGDGLPDRVMHVNDNTLDNYWLVQFNTGTGFAPAVTWTNIHALGMGEYDQITHVAVSSGATDVTRVDFFDINGDGLPDRVIQNPNSPYTNYIVQLNLGPIPDLLSTVSNGIGGSIQVSYVASTTLDNRNTNWVSDPWAEGTKSLLPFNTWVVSQVTLSDGMGMITTNSYAFKGGFYNPTMREFCGFSQCTATDPLGVKTTTYFHQSGGRDDSLLGEYLDQNSQSKMGMPYRIDVVGNDGNTNRITLNKVEEVLLNTNGWYFPFVSQTIVDDFEGLSIGRAVAQQFSYDTNTGNLLMTANLGEVTNVVIAGQTFTDIGNDSVYNFTTYTNMGAIIDRPSDILVTSDSAGVNRLRESQLCYDSKGRLLISESWLDSAGMFITNAQDVYDQYGNLTSSTDPAGITTATAYDSTYEQFPISVTTGTFTSSFLYDTRSAQAVSTTDVKGLVTSNVFDVFFRSAARYVSTNPYGPAILWQTRNSYSLGGISNGISLNCVFSQVNNAVDETNGFQTYVYSDGSGRTIETRSEAENGQYRVANITYDLRGDPYFDTLSYFGTGTGYTALSGTELGTLTEYDAVGRAFRETPGVQGSFSSGTLTATNITGGDTGSPVGPATTAFVDGGNPWVTVATDANGKVTKTFQDAYGRITSVLQIASTGNITTTYGYDLLGNHTNVTDSAGNITTLVYDSLGRKIKSQDLDMGTWTYSYDVADRLTQQVDARTNTTKLFYADALGRLTSKQIYNQANQLVESSSYIYDVSDDTNYVVFPGQLYKIVDSQGYSRSSYDVRGRALKAGRFLSVNAIEYVTLASYDDADRVQQLTYPGNSAVIGYTYDVAGHLTQVKSVSGTGTSETFYTSGGYNGLDQLAGYTNGNGVATGYAYFANSQRLQNLVTGKSGTNYQNLNYGYDVVSDVTSINDGVYSGSASASISSIQYDDLYRVISVNSTARGTKIYGYNAIGNLLTNGDSGTSMYQYGSSRPHAVTSANGVTYSYDSCGNMTGRGNQTLAYDSQNQLIRVSSTNDSVTFGYDDSGERLWRCGTNGYSIWIGGIYEINNGKVLCHVMAGGQRVATFEPQCTAGLSQIIGEKNWYVASTFTSSILQWPFEHGRGFWTIFGGTWGGIIVACLIAGRGVRLKRYEVRKALQPSQLWRQAVTFLLISAYIGSSIGDADAAVVYNPVFYYYTTDHLGSSNILTDRSGNLVQHYEYGTFGQTAYQNNTSAFPVSNRYTGQIVDDETGLYYYGGRYYDPQLGRFIQPDSSVSDPTDSQSLNRYSYCLNNPINATDPTGFTAEDGFTPFGDDVFAFMGFLSLGDNAPGEIHTSNEIPTAGTETFDATFQVGMTEDGQMGTSYSIHAHLWEGDGFADFDAGGVQAWSTPAASQNTAAAPASAPTPPPTPAPAPEPVAPAPKALPAASAPVVDSGHSALETATNIAGWASNIPGPVGAIAGLLNATGEALQGHWGPAIFGGVLAITALGGGAAIVKVAAAAFKAAKAAKAATLVTEDTIRIRHYTNAKGLAGIKESGVIQASDQNRVFAEYARHKPLSPTEAEDVYGIADGRGRNYIETDVARSRVSQRFNPKTGANELVIKGDVRLQNPTFTKRR